MMRALGLVAALPLCGTPAGETDRSPHDLAVTPGGRWAVTANRTGDSASLVDLREGRVAAETPAGRRPFAVALSADGRRAAVTGWLSGTLTVLDVAPPAMRVVATFPVGREPRGVALSPGGERAYVALGGEDALVVVDLAGGRELARAPAGVEPWYVALTPDGKRLAAGFTRSRDVGVYATEPLELLYRVPLSGPNVRKLAVSPDGAWAYVPAVAEQGAPTTVRNIEDGKVVANRLHRVPLAAEGPAEMIALDLRGFGAADLEGVAVSPDGASLAVTAGGGRGVYLLRFPLPFGPAGRIRAELVDPALYNDKTRFRRVHLGGRPVGIAFTPDGAAVLVANYLSNEIDVVDVAAAERTRRIPLGGPAEPSPARRGEALFYDGFRSWHVWYSCHTCHTEGHTNGSLYDTLNDGKYGNLKKVLSLRGVARTGPWTWHGWQNDLRESIRHSLQTTMRHLELKEEEVEALHAFLSTLDFLPPVPAAAPEALRRGAALFERKGCAECHAPPDYTRAQAYRVGLESPDDAHAGFNPPSLRGVGRRAPYLHDGRAATLEEVLSEHHRPSRVSGEADLTPEELADLVAFLRSL